MAVPVVARSSRLIDIGRVSENYIGANLLHFHRHYGEDKGQWADLVRRYAKAFDTNPAEVKLGALAYAVQREIENQLRSRERRARPRITRTAGQLTELTAWPKRALSHQPVEHQQRDHQHHNDDGGHSFPTHRASL